MFQISSVVKPRGSNIEHCLLQPSEEEIFYSKVLMLAKIFNKMFYLNNDTVKVMLTADA